MSNHFWKIVKDNHVLATGNMVGITTEYVENMANKAGGVAFFGDLDFARPMTVGPIFDRTWEQISAMQQKRA